jgi:hypothetical protein
VALVFERLTGMPLMNMTAIAISSMAGFMLPW